MNLIEKIGAELTRYGFEPGRTTMVVGVSGGVDSMTLLYALHTLKIETIAAHINYGKRGLESEKDEGMVRDFCVNNDLQFESRKAYDFGGNFQDEARKFRYEFYRQMKEKYHADAIALAHHYDDQVETILLKVLRGAGPVSWQGMLHYGGDVFRPMLSVNRVEIEAFASESHVPWREDASNRLPEYARNLIRLEMVPRFNKYLPGWQANVLKLAERGLLTEELLAGEFSRLGGSKDILPDEVLKDKSKLVRAAIIQYFLMLNNNHISEQELLEITATTGLQTGKKAGPLVRDRNGWRLQKSNKDQNIPVIHMAELREIPKGWDPEKLYLDVHPATVSSLKIRKWKAGDRLQPLGMKGSIKVSDLITNKKIRSDLKKMVQVICLLDDSIVAVIFPHPDSDERIGVLSEQFRIKETSQTVTQISIEKNAS